MQIAPLRVLSANWPSAQLGKTELLVPGERRAGGVKLAPGGQRMVLGWQSGDAVEYVLWDLATGQHQPLPLVANDWRWLDRNYVLSIGPGGYHLLDARDANVHPLEPFPETEYKYIGGFDIVLSQLRDADIVYLLESFGGTSAYKVLTHTQEQWSLFELGYGEDFGLTRDELQAALNTIPHTEVPIYGWGAPPQTDQRIYSPNRQFYMTRENVDQYERRVVIYTRDEQLVASTYKTGWAPYILGWAHDSSGVYFQLRHRTIGGEVPETPIFKLSPLTEEEARWAPVWAIGPWVLGLAVVAGAGWWWRRRRMTR
jgi:hypothetical protein